MTYTYTRDAFIRFAARLVADGRWTEAEAAQYIRQYDSGDLALPALPLEPGQEVSGASIAELYSKLTKDGEA